MNNERRSFLRYVLLGLSAALAAAISWGVGRFGLVGSLEQRRREVSRETIDGLVADRPLHVADAGAWLSKEADGEAVIAFDDRCTHLGCRYGWNSKREIYVCPCHGSEFSAEGAVVRGPAEKPLERLYLVETSADGGYRLLEQPPEEQAAGRHHRFSSRWPSPEASEPTSENA